MNSACSFFSSRRRLGVDFGRPEALPGAPGRSSWRSGPPLGTLRAPPGCCRDDPGTIPGHVENASDVPWELLGRHGVPGRLPRAILSRFWVPRGPTWKRLCAISAFSFSCRFLSSLCRFCRRFSRIHSILSHKMIDEMRRETRHNRQDRRRDWI